MNQASTAKHCFTTGESIFISDIRKGVKENIFFESVRSKKNKIGSIYCKPIRIEVNNKTYVYIFTIAIYGEFFCTPYDEDECKICEEILDEISDRVELELYLFSMKKFRDTEKNLGKKVA